MAYQATRFLLTVDKPTSNGRSTYEHIVYVAEFKDDEWKSASHMRRRFLDTVRRKRPNEYKDPTKKIKVEAVLA